MRNALGVLWMCALASQSVASPLQAIVHADADSTTATRIRTIASGSIGNASGPIASSSDVLHLFCLRSPDSSNIAIGSLDNDGGLSLRVITDSGVGNAVSIASSVPVSASPPVAATYSSSTGEVVIVYATTGSTACTLRTFSDAVKTTATVPLSLTTAPVRIEVAPKAGSSEVLIVAQDSSQRLAAVIWTGSEFRASSVIDAAYDGGDKRWDIAWSRAGTAMVGWARTGDSTLRVTRHSDSTWIPMNSGPSMVSAIAGVDLMSDPEVLSPRIAAMLSTASGVCSVATYSDDGWSTSTQLSATLDTSRDQPSAMTFEGAGGGLLCAWIESDATQVKTRRRAMEGTWGTVQTSASLGADIEEVIAQPQDNASGGVILARRATSASGGSGNYDDYVAYAAQGSVSSGDRTQFNGLHGANISGITFPQSPGGTAGFSNVTLNHDQTRTLSPGNYRDLSTGDRARINFSAGTYVFRSLTGAGHDLRFVCDASAGDVTIVFLQSNVEFRDRFRIERSGNGIVAMHVAGRLTVGHDSQMEVAYYVHGGSTLMRDRTRLTGHVFSTSSITVGHDGVLSLPSWSVTGSGGAENHHLYGMVVSSGSIGTVVELTSEAISGTTAPPMAITQPACKRTVRVVNWREVEPD